MKVSEIMVTNVFALTPDDSVAKAIGTMIDNSINQIPIVDVGGGKQIYSGMVFVKHLLASSAQPSSKLKGFVTRTATLSPDDEVEKAAQLLIGSGNRALPVVESNGGSRLAGIVSETDLALTSDFGHSTVDQVMSGAIVIEEDCLLAEAMSKMRRYNISRLPVINSRGILKGSMNILDAAEIIVTPRERTSKSAAIDGYTAGIKDVKVKDLIRKTVSVERGTRLNSLVENFRNKEEVVVVGEGGRPMGIVTPKDMLELVLPAKSEPVIHMAHMENRETSNEVREQVSRFIRKIQGRLQNVISVVVYADKHKTRKYSLRARIITARGVIDAKAVGYDPLSASKELVSKLERRIKAEHSQIVKSRQHRESGRRAQ